MARKQDKKKETVDKFVVKDELATAFVIDVINTDKSKATVSIERLNKLYKQSLDMNKKPRLIIGIKKTDKEYYVLKCDISLENRK